MDADLAFAGITRQAAAIRAGEVSATELTQLMLDRIERIDPRLNAYRVVMAERALAEAGQADARRRSGDERPLLGVPIAVKDNLDVAGEVTTHGSATDTGPVQSDTEIVRRLRAAGAVVLGKTTLSELAIWPQTETEAWGVTRNPWDTDRTPGGSSGGSAAAVAAGLAGAATASDGGGSIRIPAASCGLFGIKPQRGRVPLDPDHEHWHGLSVYGAVTRTVADSALYLDVVTESRELGEAAARPPGKLRIAVSARPSGPVRVRPEQRRALEETAALLRSLGHEVHDAKPVYGAPVLLFLPRYAHGIAEDVMRLADPARLEAPTRQLAWIGRKLGLDAVAAVRRREPGYAARLNRVFERADVLLTPALPSLPQKAGAYMGRGLIPRIFMASETITFMNPWNITGQPAAVVPAGSTDSGFPLSVQLVGRPGDEATLLGLSAQIEAERPWADRRPPIAD